VYAGTPALDASADQQLLRAQTPWWGGGQLRRLCSAALSPPSAPSLLCRFMGPDSPDGIRRTMPAGVAWRPTKIRSSSCRMCSPAVAARSVDARSRSTPSCCAPSRVLQSSPPLAPLPAPRLTSTPGTTHSSCPCLREATTVSGGAACSARPAALPEGGGLKLQRWPTMAACVWGPI
jgi:hypothetical protein